VDELIIVSNHSMKGVRTIGNILELIKELKLNVKRQSIVINQAPGQLDPMIVEGSMNWASGPMPLSRWTT